jgi:proteasome lid subunit RPN8/RPN11
MISIPRGSLERVFRDLESCYPKAAGGGILGRKDPDAVSEFTPPAVGPEGGLNVPGGRIGLYVSHPDGDARLGKGEGGGLRFGETFLVVSVRNGKSAEWACWRRDENDATFKPRVVRLTE